MSKQNANVNDAIFDAIREASSKMKEIPLPKSPDMETFNKNMEKFRKDVTERLATNLGAANPGK